MITYQVEEWSHELYREAYPLLLAQYHEIATDKEVKPYDPDFDQYQKVADLGMMRIVTARDRVTEKDPGYIVGYFVCIVTKGLHYQQTTIALNDILYIDPQYRGGTTGYRLFKFAIEDLKNLGADILTIHMKTDYPFRSLLEKLGFHLTEENWERVL
jgi:GNAT superfamily N-acetyltransferase